MTEHRHIWRQWNADDFNNLMFEWHADGSPILVLTRFCNCGESMKEYVRLEPKGRVL